MGRVDLMRLSGHFPVMMTAAKYLSKVLLAEKRVISQDLWAEEERH